MSENILSITTESWDKEVVQSSSLVVIDFWGTHCRPCKTIAPMIEELAKEYTGRAKIVKVNVEESPEIASRYKVIGVPTIMFFKDGNIVDQIVGVVPKEQLKSKLESLI